MPTLKRLWSASDTKKSWAEQNLGDDDIVSTVLFWLLSYNLRVVMDTFLISPSLPRGDSCFIASAGSELWAHIWFLKFTSRVNITLLLKWTHYRRQQYRQKEDGAILTSICHPQWASAASCCFSYTHWDDALLCFYFYSSILLCFSSSSTVRFKWAIQQNIFISLSH